MTGVALGERGVGGSVDSETVHLAAPRSSGRTVVVVGQGIDGLTIAMRVARAGYSVVGIDEENDRVRSLAQGQSPIAGVTDDALSAALRSGRYVPTTDYAQAAGFGTAIITVPARHSTEHENVEYLRSAAGSLAPHLQGGTAVVVEGVGHPSVVRQVVLPLLEAGSGLRAGRDFTFGIAGSGLLGGAAMAAGRADIVAVGPRSATAIGDFLRSLASPEADRRRPSPGSTHTQVIPRVAPSVPPLVSPTEVIRTAPPPPPVRPQARHRPSPPVRHVPVRRQLDRGRPAAARALATVTVIVPAHNEEQGIASTIEGLLNQRVPEWLRITNVVIVVNNSTDRTAAIARRYPVTVLEMPHNKHKKSGAMNAGWASCGRASEYVLTMDADTVLLPDTVAGMARELVDDPMLGGVCARYWAKDGRGLLWRLQRLEYARYDDMRELRRWRVNVLSGAAAMYRQEALDTVAELRGRSEPWDNASLIEDYALTLDLKANGWRIAAARDAHVYTEPPVTWRALWRQRLRWGRGGMDECLKRGWTAATRRDILAYCLFALSVFFRALWIAMITLMVVYSVPLAYALIGLIPVAVMWAERMTSAWRLRGRTMRDVLLVAVLIVEDLYGFFLELCAVAAATKCLAGKRQAW